MTKATLLLLFLGHAADVASSQRVGDHSTGRTRSLRPSHRNSEIDRLSILCPTWRSEENCEKQPACAWMDRRCVNDPLTCTDFLHVRSCEQSDLDCKWKDTACIDIEITPEEVVHTTSVDFASEDSTDVVKDDDTSRKDILNISTPWPTYSPTLTQEPSGDYFASSRGETAEMMGDDCKPIGSRGPGPAPTPLPPTPKNPSTPRKSYTETPTTEEVTFRRGDLIKDIERFGFKVSKAVNVRMLAKAGLRPNLADGTKAEIAFHAAPDGAAVIELSDGRYAYVSNSEVAEGGGGVYAMYFDRYGNVDDYKQLLSGTRRNCSGGTTPWNTWVSCEETGRGQCWQVDPDPSNPSFDTPAVTKLGEEGGNYEAVAVDNTNPRQPIFFLTEDHEFGALRKFTPPLSQDKAAGWKTLHDSGGIMQYLVFLNHETFVWSCDEEAARKSQSIYFPNVEGINYHDGKLYFVSKRTSLLYVLDLDTGTYVSSNTKDFSMYDGEFQHSPDNLVRTEEGKFLYFTEDGGKTPGVYALDESGNSYAIFEAYGSMYHGDETTGLAFSPDGTRMYACFQDCGCEVSGDPDCGCLIEFWRNDGRTFDGRAMDLKSHPSDFPDVSPSDL